MEFTKAVIQKIKLSSLLIALAVFFLPWISVQCSGQKLISQTGIETIYGGATMNTEIQLSNSNSSEASRELYSPLIGLAFICILIACIFAVIAIKQKTGQAEMMSSALPAVAIALLLIQLLLGFPIDKELSKELSESSDIKGEISDLMAKKMFSIKIEPAFYFELASLALPSFFLLSAFNSKNKKNLTLSSFSDYDSTAYPKQDDDFQRNTHSEPSYQEPQYSPPAYTPPIPNPPAPARENPQPANPQPANPPHTPIATHAKIPACTPLTYTSPYKFNCPHCKQRYALKIIENKAISMNCSRCGQKFLVGAQYFNLNS